jgi:4-amino-4-deoxy-L-arabinose transferase-like glycosyltransferase
MKKYLQNITRQKTFWILVGIILVGIFLRTYQYANFLRFNPDQARDAGIVRDAIKGESALPLLGPVAGGTTFKLGPAFYDFEYASAKIFGATPVHMAYPDLLTSILFLPLLYLFLRKFFSRNITLAATALAAVSFYAVKYSRFAWNPNSTPFWTLLTFYAFFELVRPAQNRRWLWALILGIASGIAIQLHSLALFTLPIVFLVYFIYLFFKKNPAWRWAPLVLVIVLLANSLQIASEFQTGGKNIQSFFRGLHTKTSRSGTLADKFVLDTVCHIQGEGYVIVPIGNDSHCDFMNAAGSLQKNNNNNLLLLGDMLFASIFVLGGYGLLFQAWRRETGAEKKIFLELILLYAAVLFILLIPLADEISFRFFLVVEFLPFVFAALWLKFFEEHLEKKYFTAITAVVVGAVVGTNLAAAATYAANLSGVRAEGPNGFEEITLGEVKYMADFMETKAGGAKIVYVQGSAADLFEVVKPIGFFTNPAGLKVIQLKKGKAVLPTDKIFFISVRKDPAKKSKLSQSMADQYALLASGKYGRVAIYELGMK